MVKQEPRRWPPGPRAVNKSTAEHEPRRWPPGPRAVNKSMVKQEPRRWPPGPRAVNYNRERGNKALKIRRWYNRSSLWHEYCLNCNTFLRKFQALRTEGIWIGFSKDNKTKAFENLLVRVDVAQDRSKLKQAQIFYECHKQKLKYL